MSISFKKFKQFLIYFFIINTLVFKLLLYFRKINSTEQTF